MSLKDELRELGQLLDRLRASAGEEGEVVVIYLPTNGWDSGPSESGGPGFRMVLYDPAAPPGQSIPDSGAGL